MTGVAILVVAAAVMLAAPVPSYACLRLRRLGPEGRVGLPQPAGLGSRLADRPLVTVAVSAGLVAIIGIGVAADSGGVSALVVPAVAAASIGAVAGWLLSTAAGARRERRLLSSLGTAVAALSAELRAGQPEPAAFRAAAATVEPELAVLLARAADVAADAGDVASALRTADDQPILPGAVRSSMRRVAAAWAVSRDCGASVGSVLDHVEDDLRAHRRRSQHIEAQLAGPRATAALLSLLPLLGVALGGAVGARPVAVLFGTPAGELALLVGVAFGIAGVLWTARIVRAAGRSP